MNFAYLEFAYKTDYDAMSPIREKKPVLVFCQKILFIYRTRNKFIEIEL